jgi:hypothetical protein
MTGILQNTNEERFFLTRYGLGFQPVFAIKNNLCRATSCFCQSPKQMLTCAKFKAQLSIFY